MANADEVGVEAEDIVDEVDVEEFALAGRLVPRARRYRIRVDRERIVVHVPSLLGREILRLAGRMPAEQWILSQRFRGGEVREVGLDEEVDLTRPGVERFMTLPREQTEG